MTTQKNISLTNATKKALYLRIWLFNLIKQTIARNRQNKLDQKMYRQLTKLPNYLLKDLGISRSEINMKLDKPWWWS